MRTTLLSAAEALVIAGLADAADAPPRPASRAEATAVVRDLRRIVTPNGVERA